MKGLVFAKESSKNDRPKALKTLFFTSVFALAAHSRDAMGYQPPLSDLLDNHSPVSTPQSALGSTPDTIPSVFPSPVIPAKARSPPKAKARKSLSSSWAGGNCKFENNTLTYFVGQKKASIKLDVKVAAAEQLVCSDYYSALLTSTKAIVALGANPVFDGALSLGGFINDEFVWANSYTLNTSEPASEGMPEISMKTKCSVKDDVVETGRPAKKEIILDYCLRLTTPGKSVWTIDVTDPAYWYLDADAVDPS